MFSPVDVQKSEFHLLYCVKGVILSLGYPVPVCFPICFTGMQFCLKERVPKVEIDTLFLEHYY